MKTYRYLFGPVPSRRLGRSLGVDLTPYKTCSLDCIFCQLGRTRHQTMVRREYVSIEAVVAELECWFKVDGDADYITLSGSGEPTLHSGFGKLLSAIQKYPVPSALLTNSTTLYLPEVRDAASLADVVKVSLSAWNQRSFEEINRPQPGLKFDQLVQGLKEFRGQFKGNLWMEVFLLLGMNTMPSDIEKISAIAKQIRPDRIHFNTAVRPPAEDFAMPVSNAHMEALKHYFDPSAEIIAEFQTAEIREFIMNEEIVLSILKRRPCTVEQISKGFGMHPSEILKYIGRLIQAGYIRKQRKLTEVYYESIEIGQE